MSKGGDKPIVLGFLTVRPTNSGGLRGGYLLTNEYGRPIEFHYTSELRVSRQQAVLFGTQFEPYVYAEALGKPLTDHQGTAPHILLVDQSPLLPLRRSVPAPVVLVSLSAEGSAPVLEPHGDFPGDLAALEKIKTLVPVGMDWREPFDRLATALSEIQDTPILQVA